MTLKIRILEKVLKNISDSCSTLYIFTLVHVGNAHLEIQILNCLYAIDVSNLIPMQMKQVGKIPETSDGK